MICRQLPVSGNSGISKRGGQPALHTPGQIERACEWVGGRCPVRTMGGKVSGVVELLVVVCSEGGGGAFDGLGGGADEPEERGAGRDVEGCDGGAGLEDTRSALRKAVMPARVLSYSSRVRRSPIA